MTSSSMILMYWGFTVVVCVGVALFGGAKADKEDEKTPSLQKVTNRMLIAVPVALAVVSTVLLLYHEEKAKTTVVSEESFSVVDANLQVEDKTIDLTIQDENKTTAEVTYGLPDYPNYISKILNVQSSVIDELRPNGDSDVLILQEFADGNREVILESAEGGNLSELLSAYSLKMRAQ